MPYIPIPLHSLLASVLAVRNFDLPSLLVSLGKTLCCVWSLASAEIVGVFEVLQGVCSRLVLFHLLLAHARSAGGSAMSLLHATGPMVSDMPRVRRASQRPLRCAFRSEDRALPML